MERYDFPHFTFGEDYPDSSTRGRFGKGYQFASRPSGPDEMEYRLKYEAMWFFEILPGHIDRQIEPQRNMAVLLDFYERHRLYGPFEFVNPHRGLQVVRFKDPLKWDLVKNGLGRVEPFEVKLILQP